MLKKILGKGNNDQEFKALDLESTCNGMQCEFSKIPLRNTRLTDVLLIQFRGEYRLGSMGKAELGYMVGMVKLGMAVWRPFRVAIDIREVAYEWGDDMQQLFSVPEDHKAVVIVGEKNRRAISTLMFGLETKEDIVDNKWFFDDFDKAIEKLKKK